MRYSGLALDAVRTTRGGHGQDAQQASWPATRASGPTTTTTHDAEMRKLLRVDLLIIDLSRPGDYPNLVRDRASDHRSLQADSR